MMKMLWLSITRSSVIGCAYDLRKEVACQGFSAGCSETFRRSLVSSPSLSRAFSLRKILQWKFSADTCSYSLQSDYACI